MMRNLLVLTMALIISAFVSANSVAAENPDPRAANSKGQKGERKGKAFKKNSAAKSQLDYQNKRKDAKERRSAKMKIRENNLNAE